MFSERLIASRASIKWGKEHCSWKTGLLFANIIRRSCAMHCVSEGEEDRQRLDAPAQHKVELVAAEVVYTGLAIEDRPALISNSLKIFLQGTYRDIRRPLIL